MSNLPETIRIGGTDYEVFQVKELRDGTVWLNGQILFDVCKIKIESELSEHRKFLVLWHETIHGILEHAGMDDDENLVKALGYGITQVLRDNEYLRNG